MVVSTRWRGAAPDAVITSARHGRSRDLHSREARYTVMMGIRIVCFASAAFVDGTLRWVLVGLAAFLPGIAVILANAIDRRGERPAPGQVDQPYRNALPRDASPNAGPTVLDHDDDPPAGR